MSLLTYTSLVQELKSYLERNDVNFLAILPTIVRNAELRITTDLKDLTTQELVAGTMLSWSAYIAKPNLWRETVSIGLILNDGSVKRLQPRTFEFCRDVYPENAATGEPEYYSDSTLDYIFIAPRPNIEYSYELCFQSAVLPLSDSQQENYITRRFPNLLLYACLLEAAAWAQDDEILQVNQALYSQALDSGKTEQKRREVNRTITGVS